MVFNKFLIAKLSTSFVSEISLNLLNCFSIEKLKKNSTISHPRRRLFTHMLHVLRL